MPSRASRSKSHLGCRPCKQRHLKCDEKYPVCGRCSKAQRPCSFLEDAGPLMMAPQPTPPLRPPASSATHAVLPLDLLDVDLLDHYRRRTGFEFAYRPELVPLMQVMAPHLAHTRPFLMHSILALSGYHKLAEDEVSDRSSLDAVQSRVLYHQARAVSLYVQGMSQARSEEDGVAIRIVCILLPLISLASYRPQAQPPLPPPPMPQTQQPQASLPSPAASTSTNDTDEPAPPSTHAIDRVVELFRLLRGSSVLFGVHEELLGTPLDVILLCLDFDDSKTADPAAEDAVTRLAAALPIPQEPSGSTSPRHNRALSDDAAMYALAVKGLRRMFRVLARAPDDMALVLGWMNGDALTAFIRLLQARARDALLVLAHWTVALHRWGHKWWLRHGLGQAVVREVWALLKRDDADREVMQWPASQVGLSLES